MTSKTQSGWSSRIESLEVRRHFAVATPPFDARVENGSLIVTGTAADDAIVIDNPEGAAGMVRVMTYSDNWPRVFTGVTRDVRVDLGDGDNQLFVEALLVRRDLRIRTGAGRDGVQLGGTSVGRDASIETRQGDDTLALVGVTVGGQARLASGSGDDLLTVARTTATGKAYVRGYRGDDNVAVIGSTFGGGQILDGLGTDAIVTQAVEIDSNFRHGDQGWEVGFADGPGPPHERGDTLDWGVRTLPRSLKASGTGYYLYGLNGWDDLFMYLTKPVGTGEGLAASQAYQVIYQIEFTTDIPTRYDYPVYLKAGATPNPLDGFLDGNGHYRLNLDKGNQGNAGTEVGIVPSGLNHALPYLAAEAASFPFRTARRTYVHDRPITAGDEGTLRLVVGTDSALEAQTYLYYRKIRVVLVPIRTG